tara:strand:+ start:1355 stop:1495 length:141 start_codon:yes stop_codon:yes gene_type:complete
MVLRPSRTGLASDLSRVITVRLGCGNDGGNGSHHQFRDFFSHFITS